MDHRHTEDFARRQEAAALRAGYLRAQAAAGFWKAVGHAIASAAHALWQRMRRAAHRDGILPEA
jgi:uncharacterized membrane protein